VTKPIGEWLRAGFVADAWTKLSAAEHTAPFVAVSAEGIYGRGVSQPTTTSSARYYNFSDR